MAQVVKVFSWYMLATTLAAILALAIATPAHAGGQFPLSQGWNMVGWTDRDTDFNSALSGYDWDAVLGFDAERGGITSYFTDPNKAILNNLEVLEYGKGYWLHIIKSPAYWPPLPKSLPPTPTPVPAATSVPLPTSNAIAWRTNTVSLEATNFYIVANGKTFTGKAADLQVHSDPGDPTYTSLEATWHEQGVEMRLFMYFGAFGQWWQVDSMRTYNGRNPGDWVYYPGFTGNFLGQSLTNSWLEMSFGPNKVHFDGLKLNAFINRAQPTPTAAPTATPTPTTLVVWVPQILGVGRQALTVTGDKITIGGTKFQQGFPLDDQLKLIYKDTSGKESIFPSYSLGMEWTDTKITHVIPNDFRGSVSVWVKGVGSNTIQLPTY